MNKIDIKASSILLVQGFCVGTADIIPGVSGGTMAFILGIYTRLIHAIRSFDLEWLNSILRCDLKTAVTRPDLAFLFPFVIGILVALFFFTRVLALPQLLLTAPELIYSLFFGLVAGSTLLLFNNVGRPDPRSGLTLIAGLVTGLIAVESASLSTPDASWFIMVCGILAIMAMLLPGISGSLILLSLNKYGYIFDAIAHLDLSVILPFLSGILTGLIFFSRILSWLLQHYYRQTVFLMLGLLLASFRVLWPFQQRPLTDMAGQGQAMVFNPFFFMPDNNPMIPAIAMMLLGLSIALSLNTLAQRGQ